MTEQQTNTAQGVFDAIKSNDSIKLKDLFNTAVKERIVDIIRTEVRPEVIDEINGVEHVAEPAVAPSSEPEPAK